MKQPLLAKKWPLKRDRRRKRIRNIILIIAFIQLIVSLWWIHSLN